MSEEITKLAAHYWSGYAINAKERMDVARNGLMATRFEDTVDRILFHSEHTPENFSCPGCAACYRGQVDLATTVAAHDQSYREPKRTAIGVRFDLIPGGVLAEVAKVFAHGAAKYGDRNWEQARLIGDKSPLNHALKHLAHYQAGIPDDEGDDPNIHLSHAIVNLMFELHYNLNPEKYK